MTRTRRLRDQPAEWIDHDFRPAPPGWRLVYLVASEPDGYRVMPMAGWLVQLWSGRRRWLRRDDNRLRRIIPATCLDPRRLHDDYSMSLGLPATCVQPAGRDGLGVPLTVLTPTDPLPTPEWVEAAYASLRQSHEDCDRPSPCRTCAGLDARARRTG